jgi:sec-independent protein translocase protein TatC
MSSRNYGYSDDIFKDTRMSFGDHLEELSRRMWAGLKALFVCVCLSFVLDWVGDYHPFGWKNFGIGKPVMEFIKAPAEEQLNIFFDERAWRAENEIKGPPKTPEEEAKREQEKKKFMQEQERLRKMGGEEANAPMPLRVQIDREQLRQAAAGADEGYGEVTILVPPVDLALLTRLAQERVGKHNQLSSLAAQEMFIVYFKVTLLCGFIMASPLIFYQFWAFVGAGLYPHEKRYVHVYMPFSIVLFLAGVFLCFIWVLPGAVKYLLSFNEWFGVDPDLRLSEWLSLAILLPLIFGFSFQTPLIMFFLNRLGMFTWQSYLKKWRYAVISLALFAAIINPTTDVVTMMYLFVPMIGLYLLGVLLCWMAPPLDAEEEEAKTDEEVAV